LSELELRSGSGDRAGRLRVRKAEFDRAKAEYDEVLFLPDASSQATRLALLAETLRRSLEARILWNLVRAQRPQDPRATQGLARIESIVLLAVPASATLPALLAEVELVRAATPGTSRAKAPDETWTCPVFTDDAEAAGLKFTFDNGLEPLHHLPETTSGGVALLDYDGDAWLDVYVVQGGPFPPAPSAAGGDRLYRNRGDGTFEDVTTTSRIGALARGYAHGVTVGDYDNDGRPDLFVTRWRRYALFHNRGDGTFEDVTETADLAGDRDFPTSAAFADLDGDGDLDLYVCHYGAWDTEHPALCPRSGRDGYEYCDPRTIPPLSDHLFRNDAGRFVEVTSEAGIVDPDGRGLGVVAADFDEDGKVDLYVANDTTANFLFHNLGGMRFDEIGHLAGVASNAKGGYQASMGIACGDLDGDGRLDIAVGNFLNESMTFYHNLGQCLFSDATAAIGLESHTRNSLSFGTAFLDANADGYLDLAVANGHVNDLRPEAPWRMPAQLFLGGPGSRLIDVSGRAGEPWQVPRLGRGLAIGDLDNDGRVDLLILSQNEPLAFFHNRTAGGHALALRLEGVSSNRDAVGARVIVEANGVRRVGYRFGGGSFQSASDPRFHFGIGPARMVDRVEVHWPSGKIDRFENLPSDAIYLVREGDNNPRKLACFRTSEAPSSSRP
jgi:enediyne biosynthesis protein E4